MEISAVFVPGLPASAARRLPFPPPDHHPVRKSPLLLLHLDRKSPSFSTPSIRPHGGAVSACVTGGTASWSEEEVVPSREENESPTSIPLEPIADEEQFNRIIAEAHGLEHPVIILWLASWCRKCIYLKPKLERLAADYYPSIRFYSIDVNTVPQRLVNRAGVTKMPTVQLWRDSKLQNEVIAGYKAWMAIDDVRKMIENEE